jgi:hypothetical protein
MKSATGSSEMLGVASIGCRCHSQIKQNGGGSYEKSVHGMRQKWETDNDIFTTRLLMGTKTVDELLSEWDIFWIWEEHMGGKFRSNHRRLC